MGSAGRSPLAPRLVVLVEIHQRRQLLGGGSEVPAWPRGKTGWREPQVETRPDFSARIAMDLSYRPATKAQAVLDERRVIEISPPDKDGTYQPGLDDDLHGRGQDVDVWTARRSRARPGGQSWGGYAGLSVRLSPEIGDPRPVTTSGPVEFVDGKIPRQRRRRPDYSGSFGGREAGIAILDWPTNLNSPSPWYVISDNPHALLLAGRALLPAAHAEGGTANVPALPSDCPSRSMERGTTEEASDVTRPQPAGRIHRRNTINRAISYGQDPRRH